MRISDWSSDVCSSDLTYDLGPKLFALAAQTQEAALVRRARPILRQMATSTRETTHLCVLRGGNVLTLLSELSSQARKSVVKGTGVSIRVAHGGRRTSKKQKHTHNH